MNPTVAVLGAGLAGACTALELAARGAEVVLIEQDPVALNRASLRNEGKIHLGFVYANDHSLATAGIMLDGALEFAPLLNRWTNGRFGAVATSHPFAYLVAEDSLVPVDQLAAHYADVQDRYRERIKADGAVDYLGDRPDVLVTRAPGRDLPAGVIAAFETAEAALDMAATVAVLRGTLASAPIRFWPCHRVGDVTTTPAGYRVEGSGPDGAWVLQCDQVVNALWHERMRVDAMVGFDPERDHWLYRMKYRVLVRLPDSLRSRPSATLVLGPYGDVVVHPDGEGYVSWYPVCMQHVSPDLTPPASWDEACAGPVEGPPATDIARRALAATERWFPGIDAARPYNVDAGIIFAWGETDIDDPRSGLHHRDVIGVRSVDGYHSVNTGKLTTAPIFAMEAATRVAAP